MSPLWVSFWESFRHAGLGAGLFRVAVPVAILLLVIASQLDREGWLWAGGIAAVLLLAAGLVRGRFRRQARVRDGLPPLTEDELRVARSKLSQSAHSRRL
jgi:hypothetical protein